MMVIILESVKSFMGKGDSLKVLKVNNVIFYTEHFAIFLTYQKMFHQWNKKFNPLPEPAYIMF